ncbi:MAG: hypothetical protein KME64_11865 [Scytonematopsis contorta HA4267-MV1]|nr:hypothetical protein [Scytonematopsis contorta HA4267-MV1]
MLYLHSCSKRLNNYFINTFSDNKFAVTTSFNWLSFKGASDRTFRDERGTIVYDSQKIDELFESYTQRFDD